MKKKINIYNNPNLPLMCPICFSSAKIIYVDNHYECGCSNDECNSPRFIQSNGESIYFPRIKWDKWVMNYNKRK